ncbi:MAG: hypothetical protein ABI528_09810 [bacterium]
MPLTILIIFLSSTTALPQSKKKFIVKQDFAQMLDSLIRPPDNCSKACNYVIYDSLTGSFEMSESISDQTIRIDALDKYLDSALFKIKERPHIPPRGENAPGGEIPQMEGPPDRGDLPENFSEIREDFQEINIALDRMNVVKEKLKSDISASLDLTNEKLHKTRANDHILHTEIINDFLEKSYLMYDKDHNVFEQNTKIIDDIIKKYNYGDKIDFKPLRKEILEIQAEELSNIRFLFNVTKELVSLGAKFELEKIKNE